MSDAMEVGDVIRSRSWHHVTPNGEFRFGVGRGSKDVAVFLFLGTEKRDGTAPLDLHARMDALGWMPKPPVTD